MSNPESEIQQGATVLNISSVCPRCGEVFCREHNVYGLAVKRLTDALERVKEERDELKVDEFQAKQEIKSQRHALQARCEQLEAKCAEMRELANYIVSDWDKSKSWEVSKLLAMARHALSSDCGKDFEEERMELREMLRYIAYQRTAVGITVMEMLLDEERQRKIHQLLEGK